MKFYFPTTGFLAKIQMTNQGRLENKYSSEQLFFSILNNPAYCDGKLTANFNNKIHWFLEQIPFKEKYQETKIARFYEYQTLYHRDSLSHKTAAGNSWTLAYYIASLICILKEEGKVSKKYTHAVLSGGIGNFTSWKNLTKADQINQKLIVALDEFVYHPELGKGEILFAYAGDEKLDYDFIRENYQAEIILQPHKTVILLKEESIVFHIVRIETVEDALIEILGSKWTPKTGRIQSFVLKNKKKLIKSLVFLPLTVFIILIGKMFLNMNEGLLDLKKELSRKNGIALNMRPILQKSEKENLKIAELSMKANALETQLAELYLEKGEALMDQEDYQNALLNYNLLASIKPELPEAYYKRGNVYFELTDYKKSIDDYSKALKIDPNYAKAYHNRANAYLKTGETDKAMLDYNQAITLDDSIYIFYYSRANLYAKNGFYEKAQADYAQAIKINPEFSYAYIGRAESFSAQNNYEEAVKDYSKSLEINQLATVYYCRAVLYYNQGIVKKDPSFFLLSQKDFERAASMGDEEAKAKLKELFQKNKI
ncbi:MAG TPA: hypothetical protein DHW82_00870 [Spirochaetia bacterium]|nr:MAG: hypothetical protein A2Y41_07970 [Spirochaetes bacterium GWB1_36_13]HCL55550.1 hypothetical protein [Spirochaetia bacterium]